MIIAFLTLQQLEDQGERFSQQQATRPATTGYVKASTAFVAYHFALKAQLNLLLPPALSHSCSSSWKLNKTLYFHS